MLLYTTIFVRTIPADVVAHVVRVHLGGPGEGLESLRVEPLVEEALAVEVEEEGQAVVGGGVAAGQQAGLLVVEDGRLEVAQLHEGLAPLAVEGRLVALQVDRLVQAGDRLHPQTLRLQSQGFLEATTRRGGGGGRGRV